MSLAEGEILQAAAGSTGAVFSVWWASPLAILCSTCFAGVYAWYTIRSNRLMARKQATLAMIERVQSMDYYQTLSTAFAEIRRDKAGFEQLKSPTNPQVREQRRLVLDYLNHYELIVVGIQQGALDEELLKAYRHRTIVRDWEAASDFVAHLRRPTPDSGSRFSSASAFSNLEAMAQRWGKDLPPVVKAESEAGKPG